MNDAITASAPASRRHLRGDSGLGGMLHPPLHPLALHDQQKGQAENQIGEHEEAKTSKQTLEEDTQIPTRPPVLKTSSTMASGRHRQPDGRNKSSSGASAMPNSPRNIHHAPFPLMAERNCSGKTPKRISFDLVIKKPMAQMTSSTPTKTSVMIRRSPGIDLL